MEFSQCLSYTLTKLGKPGLSLKREQEEAIRAVYDGNDVFLWLPTMASGVCAVIVSSGGREG